MKKMVIFISIKILRSFSHKDLKSCSKLLGTYQEHENSFDLDGKISSEELKVVKRF